MLYGSTKMENFVLSKQKIKFSVTVTHDELYGIKYLDMDANTSRLYTSEDLLGNLAIKCDGSYYLIPNGVTDLALIAVEENLVSEQKVIGLLETIRRHLVGEFDLRVLQ